MKLAMAISLTVILAVRLFAQAGGGTVSGTVTDQAGAAVPGAAVSIVNEGTQFSRTVMTNQSGQYAAQFFPIGPIRITVEHPGFQKLVRTGAVLTAADILTVDLELSVGNVQQSVEVNAAATVLQTQTQAVSSLITKFRVWRDVVDSGFGGVALISANSARLASIESDSESEFQLGNLGGDESGLSSLT